MSDADVAREERDAALARVKHMHESVRRSRERAELAFRERDVLAARVRELENALERARYERDQVYAVNAATSYARANALEDALQEIVALCEPDRIPLPKLNSKILRVARAALAAGERETPA